MLDGIRTTWHEEDAHVWTDMVESLSWHRLHSWVKRRPDGRTHEGEVQSQYESRLAGTIFMLITIGYFVKRVSAASVDPQTFTDELSEGNVQYRLQ